MKQKSTTWEIHKVEMGKKELKYIIRALTGETYLDIERKERLVIAKELQKFLKVAKGKITIS